MKKTSVKTVLATLFAATLMSFTTADAQETATVKLEVQLRHRLPPSLERSGKGGGRRW